MAGYYGFKMSNNAVNAYNNGEKPLSRWTKQDILTELKENNINGNFEKLTLSELKNGLAYAGWHHTSSKYNKTDFFRVDYDYFEKLDVDEVIQNRVKKMPEIKEKPKYVVAIVEYEIWVKNRFGRYIGKDTVVETVKFMDNEKIVKTSKGNKRLSSLTVLKSITQKTKFADVKRLKNALKIY